MTESCYVSMYIRSRQEFHKYNTPWPIYGSDTISTCRNKNGLTSQGSFFWTNELTMSWSKPWSGSWNCCCWGARVWGWNIMGLLESGRFGFLIWSNWGRNKLWGKVGPIADGDAKNEGDKIAAAAALPRRFAGHSWLCWPSYVVTTIDGSWNDLSTRFFTVHFWVVHL